MTHERVDRWSPALAGALVLVGLGLLAAQPGLLAAGVVPLAFVLYGRISRLGAVPDLHAERSLDDPAPTPGQRVRVTLRVENRGEDVLPDVRVVDGVPDRLAVVAGSPRAADALGPGEALTCEYTVVVRRGEFPFEAPAARVRSLAGTDVVTGEPACAGEATLACHSPLSVPAARRATGQRPGRQPTDRGGSGQEFYATRDYRPGDAVGRIDWRHYAKTGEFVTQQYREERAGETVLLVDARPPARQAPAPGHPTGAELAVHAGERLLADHEDARASVAVAALGVADGVDEALVGADGLAWVGATGRRGRARARAVLEAAAAVAAGDDAGAEPAGGSNGPTPARAPTGTGEQTAGGRGVAGEGGRGVAGDGGQERESSGIGDAGDTATRDKLAGDALVERLLDRLPPSGRVVLCSPLLDDWPIALLRALRARDREVLVVAPAPTTAGAAGERATLGHRLAEHDRRHRVRSARAVGASVVDWSPAIALEDALRTTLPAAEVVP